MKHDAQHQFILSEEQLAQIYRICEHHQLALKDVYYASDVLELKPHALTDLPTFENLQTIAQELQAQGYQYVTLSTSDALAHG